MMLVYASSAAKKQLRKHQFSVSLAVSQKMESILSAQIDATEP